MRGFGGGVRKIQRPTMPQWQPLTEEGTGVKSFASDFFGVLDSACTNDVSV